MEAFIIEVVSQFPTVAGLLILAYVLRDELKAARAENRENQLFMQQILLLILEDNPDPVDMSRARSVLRSRIEDP